MGLGVGVWNEVEACVEVEIADVADGIGLEGARAQPTAATERSAISAARIKLSGPGCRFVERRATMRSNLPPSIGRFPSIVPELSQVRDL